MCLEASCDPNEPPEVAFQEATMLQAAASQHVASCLGLYHFDADSAAERLPAVQNFSHFSHLNGHFTKGPSKSTRSSSRSRGSTRSCRSSQETKPSSDEPKPSRLCALLMERLDYSLHDLTVFSFLESEATSPFRLPFSILEESSQLSNIYTVLICAVNTFEF